ncbi:hypothetical protein L4X63_17795 [Geomonas sp. Red32]|uniref:hypothetical protein n=1 Tax=Geomonas sp. Red32 TaxID=2912856 RepID=UPI00202CC81B|nr:hypothetical protein [Geomonas sp. Red32]MCM0083441.1 hypothetical protein [Geomonas sp. Red32]
MKRLVWLAVVLAVVLTVNAADAQEVKERGNNAVTMGAATNSATIGYWHKLNDDVSLGGDFTLYLRHHNDYVSQTYQFSPGIRYYLLPEKAVSPYCYGAIIGRYGTTLDRGSDTKTRSESYTAGLQGGIGLEWFPTQRVSVAGHVGAIAQYEKNHSTTSGSFTGSSHDEGYTIGTISSGILVNLYF